MTKHDPHATQIEDDDTCGIIENCNVSEAPESEVVKVPVHNEGHGTVATTIITVLCNVIGGGVLALSVAFHFASLIPGILLLLYTGFLSFSAMRFLVRLAQHTQQFTYMGLCRYAFEGGKPHSLTDSPDTPAEIVTDGKPSKLRFMRIVAEGTILLYTFGCAVMYIVVIGDSMQPLAASWMSLTGFYADARFWIICTAPLLFVLSCAKHITELKFSSIVAFGTIFYAGVAVAIRYIARAHTQGALITAAVPESVRVASITSDFCRAIPLLTVCFGMHYNIPPLYHELQKRSVKRMDRALIPAFSTITLFYLVLGTMGYLYFGADVRNHGGDLLAQYPQNDLLINIGRLVMLLHFACVYPLLAVGCRRSFNLFMFEGDSHVSTWTRVAEAFTIVALSSLLAALSSGISQVLAFIGSLFGLHIIMTFPAVMYYRVFKNTMSTWERVLCWVTIVSGIVFSIAGFTTHLVCTITK